VEEMLLILKSIEKEHNILEAFVKSAKEAIHEGYYETKQKRLPHRSLKKAIMSSTLVPIIAEIKFVSPAEGMLRPHGDLKEIAQAIERGGGTGISVLTEPKHFHGRLEYLSDVKESVKIPVLMKDIIIDPVQIRAAKAIGADAILLISSIFRDGYCRKDLNSMIDYAHSLSLEVMLETHSPQEFEEAMGSDADLIGINNRDLKTLRVSIETSRDILQKYSGSKTIVCESGITTREEIRSLIALGADAFLIGSSIMKSRDIESTVRSFTSDR
jgi:indole-3-glycerol phosphate synthase